MTRRAFEILRLFVHKNEDKKNINQWSKTLLLGTYTDLGS
jgi:hypothetical protein